MKVLTVKIARSDNDVKTTDDKYARGSLMKATPYERNEAELFDVESYKYAVCPTGDNLCVEAYDLFHACETLLGLTKKLVDGLDRQLAQKRLAMTQLCACEAPQ